MTITLSWWIVPALITVFVFGWAFYKGATGFGGYLNLSGIFETIAAIIVSLFVWLIWALFR